MRVHSVESVPPVFQYDAYLPVSVGDPAGTRLPYREEVGTFEVRSVREVGGGLPASRFSGFEPAFGLLSSIEPDQDTGDIAFLLNIPGFAARTGRASPELAKVLEGNVVLQNPQILSQTGRFRLRRDIVSFIPDPTQEPWQDEVWLPTARIHRPDIPGCSSMYSAMNTSEDEYEASFDFGPVGVGGNVTFGFTYQQDLPATESCKEIAVPAKLTVLFGQTVVNGEVVSDGARFIISEVRDQDWEFHDIDPQGHNCSWDMERIPSASRCERNLMRATGKSDDAPKETFEIHKQMSGRASLSLGLSTHGQSLKVGIGYTRTCSVKCRIATTMMPGARYMTYLPTPADPLERCWSVLERRKGNTRSTSRSASKGS